MTRFIFILFIPLLLSVNNNPDDLLDEANRYYIAGNYEESFSLINMYVKSKGLDNLNQRAEALGERIYYFYLQSLIINNNENLDLVKEVIIKNRYFESSRINMILLDDNDIEIDSVNKDSITLDENKFEQILQVTKDLSDEELTQFLKDSLKGDQSKKVNTLYITVSVLLILFAVSLIIFSIIIINSKRKNKSLVGSLIKSPIEMNKETEEFFRASISYGLKIDKATGRKNNSQNTGELVYKISRKSGFSEEESYLNYIICHIYDIGLLKVDHSLLTKSKLSDVEFQKIKEHVSLGLGMIDFVPEKYVHKVYDCIISHHENLDGSGYPKGIREIAFLPRAVRVVEAYLSQVSTREYNLIKDKEVAINHLRSELDIIDQDIVELLFEVV